MRNHAPLRLLALTGLALSMSAAALAQSAPPQPDPSQRALRGPDVKDRHVPGADVPFGGARAGRFADRIPPPAFAEALQILSAPDAPADIKASEAQIEKFKLLREEFASQRRAYMQEHHDDFEALRSNAGERRQGRGRPGPDGLPEGTPRNQRPDQRLDMMDEPAPSDRAPNGAGKAERQTARARLAEIEKGAPRHEDLYKKVWVELTEPQRTAVQSKLDEFKAEQARGREDRYVKQRVGERGVKGGPDGAGPDAARPPRR
ncbi:MAG: hypothetical protein H7Y88_08550, partial [Phycisphaerales bacterium]|nr:hypothetical protein [Phycisphaerales bacterium]